MTTPGPRAQARARTEAAILEAGRAQLAERGAAALSLREISRKLGLVSSALYRYVDSRDALLTLLLVDAYASLADAVDTALDASGGIDPHARLATLGHSMRDWALAHPEQWSLVYGAPVPGYAAPAESTTAPGVRVMRRLVQIAGDVTSDAEVTGPYADFLDAGARDLADGATTAQAAWAVRAWCGIVGTIGMEVFGQLGPEPAADRSIGAAALDDQIRAVTRPH